MLRMVWGKPELVHVYYLMYYHTKCIMTTPNFTNYVKLKVDKMFMKPRVGEQNVAGAMKYFTLFTKLLPIALCCSALQTLIYQLD